ncbi:MAG: hypothetical protein WB810_10495 [Candidatus Cybelea sp.]
MLKPTALIIALVLALLVHLPAADGPTSTGISHDFDWNFGTWKTHIRRLLHPLSGSTQWVAYHGVVTVRPLLGGAANVEEVEADGPSHIELLDVRTFDPKSRQWIENQAYGATGALGQPAFGRFANGRGVFHDVEQFNGRTVLVRQTFFDIAPSSYAFEQAFSSDGGRTWEPNFRAHLERTSSSAASEGAGTAALSHDFDFNYGTWRTHIKYRRGSSDTWGQQTGTVTLRKVWNGRGLLEEISVDGAGGFAGLTLYLYDSQTHEWSQTYADSSDGTFGPPMIGTFSHGRGELFGQDRYGGKRVLQRGVWSNIRTDAHHFEIDVSDNGGSSWQPIFVAALTRIGPGA